MITIIVAAAIIERDGLFLITCRQHGAHLEGYWEFPGGKCEPGESHADCLRRELREELAVDATVGEELLRTRHAYADRVIELHFLRCELRNTPVPQLGQKMRWVSRDDFASLPFPPGDAELIALLSRP